MQDFDFMESIGLETKAATPEEAFMNHMTEGNYKKIFNIRYWLAHEMARFQDMREKAVIIAKHTYDKDDRTIINKPITNVEYAKIALNYHLRSNYGGWFMDVANRQKCDLAKTVGLVVAYPAIMEIVEKKF